MPVPETWTDRLVLNLGILQFATKENVDTAIKATLIPTINGLEYLAGYDYVGEQLDWEGRTLTIFYKKGSYKHS